MRIMSKNLIQLFKKYIILSIIICGMTSCANYLDKESDTELTLPMVFNDKTRTEGWLAGVYSMIPDPYAGYTRWLGWEILGDDETISERYRQWNWKVIPFILGEWTPASEWDGNYWEALPQRIREAYIFIENAHPIPEQDINLQEINYMKTECRFLAAYYYYLLANTYGAIPFKPDYIWPTDTPISEMMQEQRPYDEVIQWVANEMLECSKLLPDKYIEARKYGRLTSIACLAIRARMLLFYASPLVNGNQDYANYKNSKGENIFSSKYDPDKWKAAADACKDLIDKSESAGHELYKEYKDKGRKIIDPFMSYQNLFLKRADEGNTEILFARPSCDYGGGYENLATPNAAGGNGGLGVTQSLIDAFFMENGLPISDAESGYKETGFSIEDEQRDNTSFANENGGSITQKGTYNMYCHREPRFYISVNFNNGYFPQENRRFEFFNGGKDNNHTHDAPQNGYLIRKRINPKDNVKQGTYIYRPGILYRLGEAYLNYAEALNECDPGNPDILKYLNMIRERAGIRLYTSDLSSKTMIHIDINNQNEMRKLIHMERRVELCAEGLRYDDLRRWKEAETVLNGPFYGMNFNGTDADSFYKRTIYQNRIYRKSYYWFPIFQREMDRNENLVQTPYWE